MQFLAGGMSRLASPAIIVCMVKTVLPALLVVCLALTACGSAPKPAVASPSPTVPPSAVVLPAETTSLPAAETPTPSPAPSPTDTPTATAAPVPPTVDSLQATVSADLLSCRYGPGPEYLFLYGLRKGANIKLIGQTGGNNWVWVDGKNKCWVNVKFLEVAGDFKTLPVVYPDQAPLPRSPYYPRTTILSATRDGNQVTVTWLDIPLRPGDEEDATMLHYIVETWRCEAGQVIFDPLATNDTSISFVDEPGCDLPSHGRVFVQEKHGFAGPSDIPWP